MPNIYPRFLRQYNSYSCGPVAIINALKHQGKRSTEADLKKLSRKCKTKPYGKSHYAGTLTRDLAKVAQSLAFPRMRNPTLRRIDRTLSEGHAVIITSYWDGGGHSFVLAGRTARSIFCVNSDSKRHRYVRKSVFKRRWLSETWDAWRVPNGTRQDDR